jgi:hemerythrin-like domain-containing protein
MKIHLPHRRSPVAAAPGNRRQGRLKQTDVSPKMKPDNALFKPAPSFDEPIEMLRACHERIAAQCTTLGKLAAHLPLHGADTQAQQAARNIMRYFDIAGPNHHADEEQDLFPMLIEVSHRQCLPVSETIASLPDAHRSLEALWAQLRTVLAEIAQGRASQLEPTLVDDFVDTYRSHIALEEREVLPFADAYLDRQQLAELSAAMVARRTISPQ